MSACSKARAQKPVLLDHVVGAREQEGCDIQSGRFGGLKIDHKLKNRRQLDGQSLPTWCLFHVCSKPSKWHTPVHSVGR